MCDLNGPLRFCACDDSIDLTQPYWKLHMNCYQASYDLNNIVLGKFSDNYTDPYELETGLNLGNLFDFEYNPAQDDRLEVYFNNQMKYCFVFNEGLWINDSFFGMQSKRFYRVQKAGIIKTK